MARRVSLDKATAELIAKLEPQLQKAFLAAIQDMRDGIDVKALREALEAGNINRAIQALDISPASFNEYLAARQAAFGEAGALAAAYIPTTEAGAVTFRFDMTNPRAERWIREEAGTRITGYVQEQIETARDVIVDGYRAGRGPKDIATDIAGRIDRVTGRRTGGIVGLSEPQKEYVASMRARLASGDPEEMRKVFNMSLRDKRLDARIRKAIEAGQPVSKGDIDQMTQRYSDKLLKKRAEDIARTETAQSVMGSRQEAFAQALEKEGLPDDAVEKTWQHNGGAENARGQHIAMNGEKITGLNAAFVMPDGTRMKHSHDPAGGAKHNVSCRCNTAFKINFAYGKDDT